MARTKQSARKNAGGKGKKMSTKTGPPKPDGSRPSQRGPVKPHRYRPGTVALREIRKYQKTFYLLMPKLSFARVCRELDQKLHVEGFCVHQHRFTVQALCALQVQYYSNYYRRALKIVNVLDQKDTDKILLFRKRLKHSWLNFSNSVTVQPFTRSVRQLWSVTSFLLKTYCSLTWKDLCSRLFFERVVST